jgi:hypothetical protein
MRRPQEFHGNLAKGIGLALDKLEALSERVIVAVVLQDRDGSVEVLLPPGSERAAVSILEGVSLPTLRMSVEEFCE